MAKVVLIWYGFEKFLGLSGMKGSQRRERKRFPGLVAGKGSELGGILEFHR
jgi:hypothetical protein